MFHLLNIKLQPKGLLTAPKTLANFLERAAQLYEHKVQTTDASGNTSGTGGDGRMLGWRLAQLTFLLFRISQPFTLPSTTKTIDN